MTFNLHAADRVHLVPHDGGILADQDGLLEGAYPDRRTVYSDSLADVEGRARRLGEAIRQWIAVRDDATMSDPGEPRSRQQSGQQHDDDEEQHDDGPCPAPSRLSLPAAHVVPPMPLFGLVPCENDGRRRYDVGRELG